MATDQLDDEGNIKPRQTAISNTAGLAVNYDVVK
jgi:hypothetical protein